MTRNKTLSIPGPVPYEHIQELHNKVDKLQRDLDENTRLTKDVLAMKPQLQQPGDMIG